MSQPNPMPGGNPCGCGNPTCPICFPKGVPLNFPGITPQKEKKLVFSSKLQKDFEKMQENCYQKLHRPMLVKVRTEELIYYICQECLDAYMAKTKNKKLKEMIMAFRR